MKSETSIATLETDVIARLDRLPVWPYPGAVLWIVGIGYLIAFFDITNVAFGLPVFSKVLHFTTGQDALPITASLIGYVIGACSTVTLPTPSAARSASRRRQFCLPSAAS